MPQTKDKEKKTYLTTDQAAVTANVGSSAQGMVPIRKTADMSKPRTGVDPKANDRWQRENMLRELDKIDADMKARRADHAEKMKEFDHLHDPKKLAQKNWEDTSASRKQFYEADKSLANTVAKETGDKPKYSRAPSMASVQARATRTNIVEPIANAASAALTSASNSFINSPAAKGLGIVGVMLASQKGAGQSPSVEKAYIDDWNKKHNYGPKQGPIAKGLGIPLKK